MAFLDFRNNFTIYKNILENQSSFIVYQIHMKVRTANLPIQI